MRGQLEGVAQFLEKMGIDVDWWKFDPRWVALRHNQQLVLFDWVTSPSAGSKSLEPDPGYMVHITGMEFSSNIPDLFQDSRRAFRSPTHPLASLPHPSVSCCFLHIRFGKT
ncbi:hypothetical protein FRB99_000492 [Tulasnella sp. 403]|nr:hypothetical protein FRB99_000492 [Tulasnella sp. 403]